jgi:hypothetical protein
MEITPEELKRYYASLSDELLEDVDPADLTEFARQCYQGEVERRGLTPLAAPPSSSRLAAPWGEEPAFEVEPDWLAQASCACSYSAVPGSHAAPDAARAQDVLLAAGVPCHLSVIAAGHGDEEAPQFDEYRVMVPASLNFKALSVLDREIFNPQLEDDYRAHFAALSDQELRALSPAVICSGLLDRMQRLTRAYEDEAARRNFSEETPPSNV